MDEIDGSDASDQLGGQREGTTGTHVGKKQRKDIDN